MKLQVGDKVTLNTLYGNNNYHVIYEVTHIDNDRFIDAVTIVGKYKLNARAEACFIKATKEEVAAYVLRHLEV